VPPQLTTEGLEAGKSTTSVLVPSRDPVSPDATKTVTPIERAWAKTSS
jgi:hypothetical protein